MRLKATRAILAGLLSVPALTAAVADPSPEPAGRYTMSPVDGGFLRLDKETGAVAMCSKSGSEWACKSVDDQTASSPSSEISRLENENKELKDRVKQLEDLVETKPPGISSPPVPPSDGPPGGISRLPTDEEVDQALDYLSRVYKKVREHMKDLDKPLPPDEHAPPLASPPPPPPAPKSAL